MPEYGYHLSAEEHAPIDLVRNARRAEQAGLTFALVSDHFHPWVDRQGESAFVWNVVGAIAVTTERLRLGTGVTCPLIRIHPAIVAHAAATSAAMMPGRFFLGVGTGENLNEHVLGDKWPTPDDRLEMLEEAIALIRQLWEGGYQTFRGEHYVVEQARIYTLPDEPPAKKVAYESFPNTGAPGELTTELALPRHFEQVAEVLSPEDIAEKVPCGPDPDRIVEQVRHYQKAGFDHLYFHQIGPDQEGFIRFWEQELAPRLT